jgi:hypothetical protein
MPSDRNPRGKRKIRTMTPKADETLADRLEKVHKNWCACDGMERGQTLRVGYDMIKLIEDNIEVILAALRAMPQAGEIVELRKALAAIGRMAEENGVRSDRSARHLVLPTILERVVEALRTPAPATQTRREIVEECARIIDAAQVRNERALSDKSCSKDARIWLTHLSSELTFLAGEIRFLKGNAATPPRRFMVDALKAAGDFIEQRQDTYGTTFGKDILKIIDNALAKAPGGAK